MKKIIRLGSVFSIALLPMITYAQSYLRPGCSALDRLCQKFETRSASDLVAYFVSILLIIAGIVAVLFIIIGGFQYISSGANEELAETGKKTLQNSIIGLIVIILSYVIVNVIVNSIAYPNVYPGA